MNFDSAFPDTEYRMTINGLSVGLNMPKALKSAINQDNEMAHGLPEYHARRSFLVDEYPACPTDWLRSSGRIKSYFVPIAEGCGLWLDLNGCSAHANHSAVVVSIQGVNAITGLPCADATLEQYRDNCPKHKEPFGPDRLCLKCNFKWPKQNYLATTGTPEGHLWLDGFRCEDGVIRQYVFTKNKKRGVAAAIVGESRAYALGVSFFLSKEPRPPRPTSALRGISDFNSTLNAYHVVATHSLCDHGLGDSVDFCSAVKYASNAGKAEKMSASVPTVYTTSLSHKAQLISAPAATRGLAQSPTWGSNVCAMAMNSAQHVSDVEKLEIAAGAKINQRIYDDPNSLDFWQNEPEGLIVINYVSEQDAERIIDAGKIDLNGSKEGYLQQIQVGN